ncbi:MAG: IS21 family transposase [Lachnospiraceae bacterium]|nr:IS21 family transposase [Fusicatenibacter sp.]MDD6616816.1 IS21 family transposase [Lachnospiraceae bacterium]
MVNYREILRLHSLNYSQREIAASVHSSRSTIQEVLSLASALKISWPLTPEITNAALQSLLYPERAEKNTDRMMPDFPKIHSELAKKGVTLSLLWTEYCTEAHAAGKIPYMSTQFGDLYRKWAQVSKATMRIQRKPGDTFEVDWAGKTIDIYDRVTGEITPAYLFVGVLSCSGLIYAEACMDMKAENFISCHVHAYEYFGGVTRLLVPDNLRAGVTKNTRYETVIPRAYREMAEYYDTAIVPARVKAPDDKPNAEGSVKFATTWILAAIRNYHFFSLEEAKLVVAEKLEELNDRPFQKRVGSRRSAYENEEKEFMQPLPNAPYEPAVWATAKIQNDYTVFDGLNRYSVPFDLIGEQVDIRLTKNTVEVFFHDSRVASHVRRKKAQRDAFMIPEHMPEAHRKYLSYNRDAFLSWAELAGPSVLRTVQCFLDSGKEPEQGYKYCASLMKAADRYGQLRVDAACERVLSFSSLPTLRNILTVLKNGQDKVPLNKEPDVEAKPVRRSQGITRGANAFRKGGANA